MAVNSLQQAYQTHSDELKPLLHELQLGEQLNECVHQTRRADFSLMLAMLAEDVREQSQFILPKAAQTLDSDNSNHALRQQFELPDKAPLALSSMDEVDQFNQAHLVEKHDVASIHLSNALAPNALAFRDDKQHIATDVMTNTSVYCQLKHRQQKTTKTDSNLNKPLDFNVQAWLNGIQNALVKAPLVS